VARVAVLAAVLFVVLYVGRLTVLDPKRTSSRRPR
jgi:hypothetical protein